MIRLDPIAIAARLVDAQTPFALRHPGSRRPFEAGQAHDGARASTAGAR